MMDRNDDFIDELSKEELKSRLKNMQEKYRNLGGKDVLTGIWDQLKLENELNDEINRTGRYMMPLSLVFFDLDHLKRINEEFGDITGDLVLRKVADIVNSMVRTTDIFGRYGEGEFMILLPGTNEEDAYALAERIRSRIEETVFPTALDTVCSVTASIGVIECVPSETRDEAFERVEEALSDAKKSGRNCVKVR